MPSNANHVVRVKTREQPDAGTLKEAAGVIAKENKRRLRLHASHEQMNIGLIAIYIKEDVYYFRFRVSNRSNISYSAQSIAFTC